MHLILSDIHGNLSALKSVLNAVANYPIEGVILLGDLIDYGMRSNEVVSEVENLHPIIVNIWGNHEEAILQGEYRNFSSERGRVSAMNTRKMLTSHTIEYIKTEMNPHHVEFEVNNLKCLAIHGSFNDEYWEALSPSSGDGMYSAYDVVFSGHSHLPHYFEKYYDAPDKPEMRCKKRTVFINPGSVGQPRNHNPNAQCALYDFETGTFTLLSVMYDISYEQQLFTEKVDPFYKERLSLGV